MKFHFYSPSPLGMMVKVDEIEHNQLTPIFHLPLREPMDVFSKPYLANPSTTLTTRMATFTLSHFDDENGYYVLQHES